jgi:hypothetical protein
VIDKQSATMTVSYLHDSLEQLTDAVICLLDGTEKSTSVTFMDEPGEHGMFLTLKNPGRLNIQIRWFNDWASWGMYPEDKFTVVFDEECDLLLFAKQVNEQLDKLYIENGLEGYKKKWIEHDFPFNKYMKLIKMIKKI